MNIIEQFPGIVDITTAIISLSVIISAIGYAVGSALNLQELKNWVKKEIFEILFSILLLLFFFGTYSLLESTSYSLAKNLVPYYTQTNEKIPLHIDIAVDFTDNMIKELDGVVSSSLKIYSINTLISSLTLGIGHNQKVSSSLAQSLVPTDLRFSLSNIYSPHIAVYSVLYDFVFILFTAIGLEKFTVIFLSLVSSPYLVAAGIALRSFKFTRKLGGLLLALGFSLYFIFPFIFVMGNSIYYDLRVYSGATDTSKPILYNSDAQELLLNKLSQETGVAFNSPTEDTGSLELKTKEVSDEEFSSSGNKIWSFMKNIIPYTFKILGFRLSYEFDRGEVIDGFARVISFIFVFSFLAIMATIAATRSLAETFGGDIEIAGLTHIL